MLLNVQNVQKTLSGKTLRELLQLTSYSRIQTQNLAWSASDLVKLRMGRQRAGKDTESIQKRELSHLSLADIQSKLTYQTQVYPKLSRVEEDLEILELQTLMSKIPHETKASLLGRPVSWYSSRLNGFLSDLARNTLNEPSPLIGLRHHLNRLVNHQKTPFSEFVSLSSHKGVHWFEFKSRVWTDDDDRALLEAIRTFGPVPKAVSSQFPSRCSKDVWRRYKYLLSSDVTGKPLPWTLEQDSVLLNAFSKEILRPRRSLGFIQKAIPTHSLHGIRQRLKYFGLSHLKLRMNQADLERISKQSQALKGYFADKGPWQKDFGWLTLNEFYSCLAFNQPRRQSNGVWPMSSDEILVEVLKNDPTTPIYKLKQTLPGHTTAEYSLRLKRLLLDQIDTDIHDEAIAKEYDPVSNDFYATVNQISARLCLDKTLVEHRLDFIWPRRWNTEMDRTLLAGTPLNWLDLSKEMRRPVFEVMSRWMNLQLNRLRSSRI